MERTIAVLPGDGIGPEVIAEAVKVLRVIGDRFNCEFRFAEALVGGAAFERYGVHFPEETGRICEASEAILFGAVGGPVSELHLPKWHKCEANSILALRKRFAFAANLRPVRIYRELAAFSPLRQELLEGGVDILFVRELLGDLYFGDKRRFERDGVRVASDVAEYTEVQVAQVAHVAFLAAGRRRGKVTSVDKANVLETSRLWREVVREIAVGYPGVELEEMLVDNCAMQIIRQPGHFDVILTSNMFGDILSDAGGVIPGSLGMLASASMNEHGFGLFEPPSGSAPDIAGANVANPIGAILSAGMLLRFSLKMEEAAQAIEAAVSAVLAAGGRTKDITLPGEPFVGTKEMGDLVAGALLIHDNT